MQNNSAKLGVLLAKLSSTNSKLIFCMPQPKNALLVQKTFSVVTDIKKNENFAHHCAKTYPMYYDKNCAFSQMLSYL